MRKGRSSPPARRHREIIVSNSTPDVRPIRAETRTTLVRSIAVGRRWLQEIVDGSAAGPDEIAAREGCSRRHVMMMISLSFLAPDLVRAAIGWPPTARHWRDPPHRRTHRVVTTMAHARALTTSSRTDAGPLISSYPEQRTLRVFGFRGS